MMSKSQFFDPITCHLVAGTVLRRLKADEAAKPQLNSSCILLDFQSWIKLDSFAIYEQAIKTLFKVKFGHDTIFFLPKLKCMSNAELFANLERNPYVASLKFAPGKPVPWRDVACVLQIVIEVCSKCFKQNMGHRVDHIVNWASNFFDQKSVTRGHKWIEMLEEARGQTFANETISKKDKNPCKKEELKSAASEPGFSGATNIGDENEMRHLVHGLVLLRLESLAECCPSTISSLHIDDAGRALARDTWPIDLSYYSIYNDAVEFFVLGEDVIIEPLNIKTLSDGQLVHQLNKNRYTCSLLKTSKTDWSDVSCLLETVKQYCSDCVMDNMCDRIKIIINWVLNIFNQTILKEKGHSAWADLLEEAERQREIRNEEDELEQERLDMINNTKNYISDEARAFMQHHKLASQQYAAAHKAAQAAVCAKEGIRMPLDTTPDPQHYENQMAKLYACHQQQTRPAKVHVVRGKSDPHQSIGQHYQNPCLPQETMTNIQTNIPARQSPQYTSSYTPDDAAKQFQSDNGSVIYSPHYTPISALENSARQFQAAPPSFPQQYPPGSPIHEVRFPPAASDKGSSPSPSGYFPIQLVEQESDLLPPAYQEAEELQNCQLQHSQAESGIMEQNLPDLYQPNDAAANQQYPPVSLDWRTNAITPIYPPCSPGNVQNFQEYPEESYQHSQAEQYMAPFPQEYQYMEHTQRAQNEDQYQ